MSNIRANDSWFKVSGFIGDDLRILDVGCSSGNLGKALKEAKNSYVVGVDIDSSDVKIAKKVLDEAHLVNLETDELSYLGKFDVIIMADVIEHLVNPVGVLKKLKELLRKDGRLIFSVPNMANVTIRLEVLKGSFEYKDFGLLDRTHLHYYDRNEIERVLAAAGLYVAETDCTVRTVPDDILRKELSQIGIDLTSKLRAHLNSTDAATFQFIGWAKPGKRKSHIQLNSTTPLDVITKEIDTMRLDFNNQVQIMEEKISVLETRYDDVLKQLESIYNSKGWAILTRIYAVKKSLASDASHRPRR